MLMIKTAIKMLSSVVLAATVALVASNPLYSYQVPYNLPNAPWHNAPSLQSLGHAPAISPIAYMWPSPIQDSVEPVGPPSLPAVNKPLTYAQILLRQQWGTLVPVPRSEAHKYPCVSEGFFAVPTNCSQFYRCVNYTTVASFFTRYLFSCPAGTVFLQSLETCVPGTCDNMPVIPGAPDATQPPVVEPAAATESPAVVTEAPVVVTEAPVVVTDAPVVETQAPEVATDAPVVETDGPLIETDAPVIVTDAPVVLTEAPVVATSAPAVVTEGPAVVTKAPAVVTEAPAVVTEAPAVVTEAPAVVTEAPAVTDGPADECPESWYVQHPDFCNIYQSCANPADRYVCPVGTAFDEPKQMCRIASRDDPVCSGKRILYYLFRSPYPTHLYRNPFTGSFGGPITGSLTGPVNGPLTGPFNGPLTGPFNGPFFQQQYL